MLPEELRAKNRLEMNRQLHAKLAFQAKTMGISLNSYVTEQLRHVVP
ncbi:MAG: toxin-antitoxin system HicB family antitoxin [Verrucomicrobia bacterium]|nr:toxin-antitoxin system HicB family antitoxin [Verrucomicrobiota bacterium]